MEQNMNPTSGSIKISVDVIRTIVRNILNEIEGVHSLASSSVSSSLRSPIDISLDAEIAVVNISVNVCFGFRIKDVAHQIQTKVKDAVQDMTGMAVSRVNVLIADICTKETA